MTTFTRSTWTTSDSNELIETLNTHSNLEKESWARRILNTKLKLWVAPTPLMRRLSKEIHAGDYRSFLQAELEDGYETRALKGIVISLIEDDQEKLKELDRYAALIIDAINGTIFMCPGLDCLVSDHPKYVELKDLRDVVELPPTRLIA